MEIAQGYARQPKRIYAVEKCGFFHFIITLSYPFCTNFLQTFLMKKVHLFRYFVVLCWFWKYVSLKYDMKQFMKYCCDMFLNSTFSKTGARAARQTKKRANFHVSRAFLKNRARDHVLTKNLKPRWSMPSIKRARHCAACACLVVRKQMVMEIKLIVKSLNKNGGNVWAYSITRIKTLHVLIKIEAKRLSTSSFFVGTVMFPREVWLHN